jgi:hypothetical protein
MENGKCTIENGKCTIELKMENAQLKIMVVSSVCDQTGAQSQCH